MFTANAGLCGRGSHVMSLDDCDWSIVEACRLTSAAIEARFRNRSDLTVLTMLESVPLGPQFGNKKVH